MKYQIISHGFDGSQYFPGCGAGRFENVATGCGANEKEAFEDALDQIAMVEATRPLVETLEKEESANFSDEETHPDAEHEENDIYYYLSVRYSL